MKIVLVMFILVSSLVAHASMDSQTIKEKVEVRGFVVGDDGLLGGQLSYMVDRTSKLCFAVFNGKGNSMVPVKCKSLMKIQAIKTYIETGRTSK
jgi:hypothetical protein